jgi:hypothetical protein
LSLLLSSFYCYYYHYKGKGASTLSEFRDFFIELDRDELADEYKELPKLMIYTLKKLLTKLTDDQIAEYFLKACSISSS